MSDQIQEPVNTEPVSPAPAETRTQPEVFHEVLLDGEKEPLRFKTKDDLDKYIKTGTLRHTQYSKKYDALQKERAEFDKRKADFGRQYQDFTALKTRYDGYDSFLRSRPDVQKRLVEEMRGRPPQEDLKGELTKMLNEFKTSMERKEAEREAAYQNEQYRNEIFESMGKKYDDFDKDEMLSLMREMEGFSSLPPKAAMEAFAELLYHSMKGKLTPAQIEERLARRIQRKQTATPPMPGGGPAPRGNGKFTGTHDEIAAALKASMR